MTGSRGHASFVAMDLSGSSLPQNLNFPISRWKAFKPDTCSQGRAILEEVSGLLSSLDASARQKFLPLLKELKKEREEIFLLNGLLQIGISLKSNQQEIAARSVLERLAQADIPEEIRAKAAREGGAMTGTSPFGMRAEYLGTHLIGAVMGAQTIVPMFGAAMIGQMAGTAVLGRLVASPTRGFFTRGFGARLAAGTAAFLAEFPAFAGLSRAASPASNAPFREDLMRSALSLGAIRIFSGLGSKIPLLLAQPAATFLGLLAANKLEQRFHLRPPTEHAAADTLASMLGLLVGANLGNRVLGSSFAAFRKELELRADFSAESGKAQESVGARWTLPYPCLPAGRRRQVVPASTGSMDRTPEIFWAKSPKAEGIKGPDTWMMAKKKGKGPTPREAPAPKSTPSSGPLEHKLGTLMRLYSTPSALGNSEMRMLEWIGLAIQNPRCAQRIIKFGMTLEEILPSTILGSLGHSPAFLFTEVKNSQTAELLRAILWKRISILPGIIDVDSANPAREKWEILTELFGDPEYEVEGISEIEPEQILNSVLDGKLTFERRGSTKNFRELIKLLKLSEEGGEYIKGKSIAFVTDPGALFLALSFIRNQGRIDGAGHLVYQDPAETGIYAESLAKFQHPALEATLPTDRVELKNGKTLEWALVAHCGCKLQKLIRGYPTVFYELVRKSKDPDHEYFGNSLEILKNNFELVADSGIVPEAVRDVVLSSIQGEDLDLTLTSPLAQDLPWFPDINIRRAMDGLMKNQEGARNFVLPGNAIRFLEFKPDIQILGPTLREEIFPQLTPQDFREMALQIEEGLSNQDAAVRHHCLTSLVKLIPHLDPADRPPRIRRLFQATLDDVAEISFAADRALHQLGIRRVAEDIGPQQLQIVPNKQGVQIQALKKAARQIATGEIGHLPKLDDSLIGEFVFEVGAKISPEFALRIWDIEPLSDMILVRSVEKEYRWLPAHQVRSVRAVYKAVHDSVAPPKN